MADTNLGNLYYTVGMKGIADAKKQLAELSEAIKKGAISGPLPTAADFANKDAVGEKFANSILEKTKLLQSSLEKALRASDQKTAARLNSELRKLEGIDPTKGSSAVFFAKTSGYSAEFVGKLEKAVAETARKAFEAASKQLANEMAQMSEKANRFGAGIKFRAPAAPLAGGGVASQSFGDPGRYVPGGPRYGSFPDAGPFGQYIRPLRPAGQLAGGLPGGPSGPLFGSQTPVASVSGTRKVLVSPNDLSDVFNAGLSVRTRSVANPSGGGGEFGQGVGNLLQNAITGKFRRLDLRPTIDRSILPASELSRRASGAGPRDYFGEGIDDFGEGLFGEGGRKTSKSGARAVIEEMFGDGVFGDMAGGGWSGTPGPTTTGRRRRIGKRRWRPSGGHGNYPYNDTFGEGAYDDPPEPGNTEPYGPDPMYGPNAPSYYGLPGGPTYRGSGPGGNRLNPWLVNVDRTRRRAGHQALTADAGRASELAGEISGQVFNYDMNTNLRDARRNVLREHRTPGSTGSDLTTRQNELVDLQEKAVHLASRRAEIEQRVNSYLGTQVDYSHKIAAEEEAALNFARQRMGRDLTQSEERGIREDTRNQSMRTMLGEDASGTSGRLTTIQKELDDLNSARPGATTDLAAQMDKRIRNLREEASILVRREQLLRRQAELENQLAGGGGTWNERRLARRELGGVQRELVQNEITGENARRNAAGQRSRNANYRLQELSYGAQDFAQVLSGGGGLDAALRAANNNISQFFAAAGGPNAARYSLMATVGILGIAAALKMMDDSIDGPNKKLEELIDRMKEMQAVNKEIWSASKGGVVGFGEIGGAGNAGSRIVDLESQLRDAQANRNGAAELFAGRSQDSYTKMFADWGRAILSVPLGGPFTDAGNEMWSMGDARAIERAFFERFSQGKDAGQITKTAFSMTPHDQRQMDVILKSKGVSPEDAAEAFAAIKDMGGWSNKTAEELKAMTDEINRVRDIHKKMEYAADSYRLALEETAANLRRRNELLAGAGGQTQLSARAQDFAFANQQNAMARQFDKMAKMARDRGDTDIAKSHEESARKARGEADMRMRGIAPGGGAFLTGAATSLEGVLSPFNQQIQDAQQAQKDAAANKAAGRDKRLGADIPGAKDDVAIADRWVASADAELAKAKVKYEEDVKRARKTADNVGGRDYQDFLNAEIKAEYEEKQRAAAKARRNKADAEGRREAEVGKAGDGREQEAAGRRADWEAKEQEKKAREGKAFAVRDYMGGLSFGGQRANESFAEADAELAKAYQQQVDLIAANAEGNADAAAAATAKLNEAKQREEERRKSDRRYETEMRSAEAFGTSFSKQKVALDKKRRDEEREIRKNYSDDPEERRKQLDLARLSHERERREIEKMEGRAKSGAQSMFSSQAASLMGGRDAQHFSNAKQLEENLRAIEDASDANLLTEEEVAKKRREAQLIYEEQKKQIEHKQVGFSDIGGMWKQIQMSLKPDKSIEMQRIANDHLEKIANLAGKNGLKVDISLGA